jgi:hypothetical protein
MVTMNPLCSIIISLSFIAIQPMASGEELFRASGADFRIQADGP